MTMDQRHIRDSRHKATVRINADENTKERVFNEIVKWMEEHKAWSGEAIQQSDRCQTTVSYLLEDIVDDLLKPEVEHDCDI